MLYRQEDLFLIPDGGETAHTIAERIRLAALRGASSEISMGCAVRRDHEALQQTIDRAARQLYKVRSRQRREGGSLSL